MIFGKTDFVYEAGQFSVRGGIIDVYSFAYEIPYRIELFGDEVDSIRTFEPGSQLSVDASNRLASFPNIQTKLIQWRTPVAAWVYLSLTHGLWFQRFSVNGRHHPEELREIGHNHSIKFWSKAEHRWSHRRKDYFSTEKIFHSVLYHSPAWNLKPIQAWIHNILMIGHPLHNLLQ